MKSSSAMTSYTNHIGRQVELPDTRAIGVLSVFVHLLGREELGNSGRG